MQFDRPIPGQSLTSTPKGAPYERPPEINDPMEALEMHLDNLDNPKASYFIPIPIIFTFFDLFFENSLYFK